MTDAIAAKMFRNRCDHMETTLQLLLSRDRLKVLSSRSSQSHTGCRKHCSTFPLSIGAIEAILTKEKTVNPGKNRGENRSAVFVSLFVCLSFFGKKGIRRNNKEEWPTEHTYEPDLTERAVFDVEIVQWKAKWAHFDAEHKPTTLQYTLCCTNKELSPNVTAILTILLTIPVSTATPERSFTAMWKAKTYIRSTMGAERLSGLALLRAYRNRTIDTDIVIQEFCAKKPRKSYL